MDKKKQLLFFLIFFVSNLVLATEIKTKIVTELPRAGHPIPGLTANELAFFEAGKEVFDEIQSVTGTEPGAADAGLGPRFNSNSCGSCHSQPTIGGTSPAINPQFAVATRYGARNRIPYFITENGPVREARFKFKSKKNNDTSRERDGGVQNLFVITGRLDAGSCNISQPNFDEARRDNNIIFRIPSPVYGSGLIEAIPDSTILANKNADLELKKSLGISGHENRMRIAGVENRNDNDGTITRFGWKAQNKSLELFAAEAYNVEQGVTNEIFQNERDETPGCVLNGIPENHIDFEASTPLGAMSDTVLFAMFMRFLAPPDPKPFTAPAQHGSELFVSVGCALCHTPSMKTGPSSATALNNKPVNLFSDLLVHSMGPGLADNIIQGSAGPDDFRTAPLWGIGQRLYFLHDGRTSDLIEAIQAHASTNQNCKDNQDRDDDGIACRSEANQVIEKFNRLSKNDRNDIIEFLQSL